MYGTDATIDLLKPLHPYSISFRYMVSRRLEIGIFRQNSFPNFTFYPRYETYPMLEKGSKKFELSYRYVFMTESRKYYHYHYLHTIVGQISSFLPNRYDQTAQGCKL